VPLDRTPPKLRALIGYEFFKVDPETGKIRELDEVFGADAHRDFWLKLDDLAHDIVAMLEALEDPDRPAPFEGAASLAADAAGALPPEVPAWRPGAAAQPRAATGRKDAVYLAEVTSDLREQREAIRRDLQQQGYLVLPDRTLPHVAEEAEAAIREDLARSRMSIHPIGRNYGVVPEGGTRSMVEIQHELATERAGRDGFARLVWIPAGLQVDDARQQQLIERLRADPRIDADADLLETYFEDLRTMVQDWLRRERAPKAPAAADGPARTVYLIADQRDGPMLGAWVDGLFNQHLEVAQPIFDGDESEMREYHEEMLASCDGVLILYGAGNELWLRRKLREIQKAAGYGRTKTRPPVVICLAGPRTPEKERFRTHEATVVPQWNGFSLDALAPFINQLKAGGSV
jgi:hypothetical protein